MSNDNVTPLHPKKLYEEGDLVVLLSGSPTFTVLPDNDGSEYGFKTKANEVHIIASHPNGGIFYANIPIVALRRAPDRGPEAMEGMVQVNSKEELAEHFARILDQMPDDEPEDSGTAH